MEFKRQNDGVYYYNEEGKNLGRIIFERTDGDYVRCTSTFVDPSLRGQGVAGQLVDQLVDWMSEEGLKIEPVCSYVVSLFDRDQEKFGAIDARN